jgi:hypothetical protein
MDDILTAQQLGIYHANGDVAVLKLLGLFDTAERMSGMR